MKAIMKVALGVGHVEVRDIAEPQVAAGQVKLRVKAAGLCGTDLHILKDEFKSAPPVVLGHEIAAEIAEIGAGVTGLKEGRSERAHGVERLSRVEANAAFVRSTCIIVLHTEALEDFE